MVDPWWPNGRCEVCGCGLDEDEMCCNTDCVECACRYLPIGDDDVN